MEYVKNGYLQNSGMFLFKGKILMEECEEYQPEILRSLMKSGKEAYESISPISIDYGIMEKTKRAAAVPLKAEWSDVGSFSALYNILSKDEYGNAIVGDSITVNSNGI